MLHLNLAVSCYFVDELVWLRASVVAMSCRICPRMNERKYGVLAVTVSLVGSCLSASCDHAAAAGRLR